LAVWQFGSLAVGQFGAVKGSRYGFGEKNKSRNNEWDEMMAAGREIFNYERQIVWAVRTRLKSR
jgi:hypothetical protein